jgi:hypothetical protein
MNSSSGSKLCKVFKGNTFTKSPSSSKSSKNITFDLDETLGSFGELYLLWRKIDPLIPTPMEKKDVFRELLDLYPEFLRPGIHSILEFLYQKKRMGACSYIFLYTNNQCSSEWIDFIIQYFEQNMPNLFDQTVCAFKINHQRIEPLRSSHNKIYGDLIRCTLLPKNSEICFVDNTFHSKMVHDRVYYIQPKSYQHGLSGEEIIHRFMTNWKMFKIPHMEEWINFPSFNKLKSIDSLAVSQKIMYHLKEYFLFSTKSPKTKKIGWNLGRFTRRIGRSIASPK